MEHPIKVMVVDDHAIVREGLRTLLGEEISVAIVGEATNAAEALPLIETHQPDVILMDLVMPGLDSLEATQIIRQRHPTCQVLILTTFIEDERVRTAVAAGAIGYLLKDIRQHDLVRAIHAAARGEPTLHPEAQRRLMQHVIAPAPATSLLDSLTPRERDVLQLIAGGHSNKEIAQSLRLTEGTVKGYVTAILGKLEVADRTQAALYAVKHGLVPLD